MSRRSRTTPTALVAVTATSRRRGDGTLRVELNDAYLEALRSAGLVPLVVPPSSPDAITSIADVVDGLVLSGGEDVNPARYGESRGPHTEDPQDQRDETELALATLARDRALPTLAICRGLQVMNVALGGTLVQDIPSERGTTLAHRADRTVRAHPASIEQGSLLRDIVRDGSIEVNTSHHQAIGRVAEGLRVSAIAPDGVIEGAEWSRPDDWWMVGVQWHPEELVNDGRPWDRALFEAFARQVRGGAD